MILDYPNKSGNDMSEYLCHTPIDLGYPHMKVVHLNVITQFIFHVILFYLF